MKHHQQLEADQKIGMYTYSIVVEILSTSIDMIINYK
jgi:hypothetical protein